MPAYPQPLADFAAALHRLREDSGAPSVRELAALMRAAGQPYPRSTISDKLSGVSKPTWEFVTAFVRACARHRGSPDPLDSPGTAQPDTDLGAWQARYRELLRHLAASRTGARRATIAHRELSPPPVNAPAGPVPRQLPSGVPGFTGRIAELAALDGILDQAGGQPSAIGIAVLAGTAGAGKTALAVRWAHRVADRFPDGQLYVDLRGYDPDAPLPTGAALSGFLTALGVTGTDIPYDIADRAARYRSLLAGRRMLIVLDNAHSVDQIRLLLPGEPSCFVVVTSRDRLTGLVARQGAARVEVDRLPPGDALTLLHDLIGDRVAAEPADAALLAERCARLPLTLRVAAEYAAARPQASLAALVNDLAAERSMLDAFDNETDERADVRAVFSWSYHHLPLAAARLFRLLALHPGGDIGLPAAAALCGTGLADTHRLVTVLASGNLIDFSGEPADATSEATGEAASASTDPADTSGDPAATGRLRMHDLLRAYATERLAEEAETDRKAARTRLLDHYLSTTSAAMDLAFPAERSSRPDAPAGGTVRMSSSAEAHTWLDSERVNLVACVELAARRGFPDHAARLASLLWRYLDTGGHHGDALTVHQHALDVARWRDDRAEEGKVLNRLGIVYWRWGRNPDALRMLERSLAVSRSTGDRAAEGGTLNTLGLVYAAHGDYHQAIEHLRLALAAAREAHHPVGECSTLDNIGRTHWQWGRAAAAVECQHEALAVCRASGYLTGEGKMLANLASARLLQGHYDDAVERGRQARESCAAVGDQVGQTMALCLLGRAYHRLGRQDDALRHCHQAIEISDEIGYRGGRVDALNGIGEIYTDLRRFREARDRHAQALRLARADGDRVSQCGSLNGLGAAALAAGETDRALTHHSDALALAREIDQWYEQARALRGIGDVHRSRRQLTNARTVWAEAITWYDKVGAPEADDLRSRLSGAPALATTRPDLAAR